MGDQAVEFAEFYDAHEQSTLAFFQSSVFCPHTAADLAAETFSQALLSWSSFRGDSSRATWLRGIARHQLSHFWRNEAVSKRAQQRLGMRDLDHSSDSLDRIEQLVDSESLRRDVIRALDELTRTEGAALELRIIDELSYAEVAKRLGCTEGAARVRVSRGLVHLRDELVQSHKIETGYENE